MPGFAHTPFGSSPFGVADTGTDLIVTLFPDELFDDTLVLPPGQTIKNNTVDPLLMLLKTYANSVTLRKTDIDNMEQLMDSDTAPLAILRLLGQTLGLDVDQNDPDFLQRTLVGKASEWLQIKASVRGYEVRGLASGFTVQVVNFWRIIPAYVPLLPTGVVLDLKPQNADPTAALIPHTNAPPGTYPGTPLVEDETYAKSSYLKVIFSVPIYRPGVNYNPLLDLIILKIQDVQGIHHELLPPEFQVTIPVNVFPTASFIRCDETIEVFNFPPADYFDEIPADVQPLDVGLQVTMT